MKKKIKLAFEQLEQELTILPEDELLHFLGGGSTGSSSGLAWDASIDDVVDYLLDMGFPMSEDSSGNYHFTPPGASGSIMLDEVVVYGYSSGSSGSGSSGYGGIMDMYVGYFESYGYSFSGGGSGGYTYNGTGGSSGSSGNNPDGDDHPWDTENSDIIMTPTGNESHVDYRSYTSLSEDMRVKVVLEEVIITVGEEEILAFRVKEVRDISGNLVTTNLDQYLSNCHGYTFGDGQLWFNDAFWSDQPGFDPNPNEMAGFENLLNSNTLYQQVDRSQADYAVIWRIENGQEIAVHSGKVEGSNYRYKSDTSDVTLAVNTANFMAPYNNNLPSGVTIEIRYYKGNF